MKIQFMLPAAKGVYPVEAEERRIALIKSYETESTFIDVVYMPGVSGFSPWGAIEARTSDASELEPAHEFAADCAAEAEQKGYDAFLPFGLLDIGVDAARRRNLTIPAVGAAESSALFCGMLGRRFASCSYLMNSETEPLARERMTAMGLEHLFVGSTAIGIPNSEYPKRHDEVRERFILCAKEARERGAEIMGLNAMSICPIEFSAKELTEASGMPVVDSIASQIAMAQFWYRTKLPSQLLHLPR